MMARVIVLLLFEILISSVVFAQAQPTVNVTMNSSGSVGSPIFYNSSNIILKYGDLTVNNTIDVSAKKIRKMSNQMEKKLRSHMEKRIIEHVKQLQTDLQTGMDVIFEQHTNAVDNKLESISGELIMVWATMASIAEKLDALEKRSTQRDDEQDAQNQLNADQIQLLQAQIEGILELFANGKWEEIETFRDRYPLQWHMGLSYRARLGIGKHFPDFINNWGIHMSWEVHSWPENLHSTSVFLLANPGFTFSVLQGGYTSPASAQDVLEAHTYKALGLFIDLGAGMRFRRTSNLPFRADGGIQLGTHSIRDFKGDEWDSHVGFFFQLGPEFRVLSGFSITVQATSQLDLGVLRPRLQYVGVSGDTRQEPARTRFSAGLAVTFSRRQDFQREQYGGLR